MTQRVTVRERIDPAITASLFANYRSSADAVMELVDNAIDSRLKGSPLEVLLQVHPSYFVIETRGGEGMGSVELERNYLRLVDQSGSAKLVVCPGFPELDDSHGALLSLPGVLAEIEQVCLVNLARAVANCDNPSQSSQRRAERN